MRSDAGLVEQLRCELAGERFDLRVRARVPRRSGRGRGGRSSAARAGCRAARRRGGRAGVLLRGVAAAVPVSSGRSSLRSGSGVVISRSRSWQSPARFALTAPSRAATSACSAWRSPPARGVAGRCWVSTLRAARTASSASVLPPERRSRRSRPTSSTRSPRPVRKRVRPAPNEPVPSIANARRPGACRSASFSARCVAVAVRGRPSTRRRPRR